MKRLALLLLTACGGSSVVPGEPPGPCEGATDLPSAPEASGAGEHYRGTACLLVDVDLLGRDACAGTLDLRVQDDVLSGIGACRYIGLPGERGLSDLLPNDQYAEVIGELDGHTWAGFVTVHSSLGSYSWAWQGDWEGPGTAITGTVEGESLIDENGQGYSIFGEGTFEAWSIE